MSPAWSSCRRCYSQRAESCRSVICSGVAPGHRLGARAGAGFRLRNSSSRCGDYPASSGHGFRAGCGAGQYRPGRRHRTGRRLSLPPRVQALVQAESLFNDATSLLLFRVALTAVVTTGVMSWGQMLAELAVLAGGGLLAGAIIATGAFMILRRTEDPVLETVVALVTPYAAYV